MQDNEFKYDQNLITANRNIWIAEAVIFLKKIWK